MQSTSKARHSRRAWLLAAVVGVAVAPGLADAGILGTYTFTGNDPGGDNQTPNGNGTAATLTTYTSFTRVGGLAATNSSGTFRTNNFTTAATINTGQYMEFSATVPAGYALRLTSLDYTMLRLDLNTTRRGPSQAAIRSSFESFNSGSGTGSTVSLPNNTSTVTSTWDFTDYTTASAGVASFRFYGWGAAGTSHANALLSMDNITLNGDVVALARMQASAAPNPTGPVIVGAAATADVSVQNTASGGTVQEGLNFTVSGTTDISGSGGNPNLAPGAPEVISLTINTSTAGNRGGTITVNSNAYSTNGNVGQSTFNDVVSLTVLDHSNASFAPLVDDNEITVDFGTVVQGSSASSNQSIHNLVATASFTAGLDLDSILETDPDGVFSNNLATFSNLAAGGSQGFLISLDTTNLGSFSGSLTLGLSDQDLPGATGGQTLTVNLLGNVVAVPEPASLGVLLGAGVLLLRRRRA